MSTLQRRSRPNGHAHEVDPAPGEAQCPYCGQSISRKEFKEIQTRIEMEERARIAKIEADLKARVAREVAKAQTEATAAIAKAKKDAVQAAEKRVKELKASQEKLVTQRLTAQREVLAKQLDEKLAGERIAHAAERARLESSLSDLQRKLAAKSPFQAGEKPEADLYEAMVLLCVGDRVTRTRRGVAGGDVLIEVVHQPTGEVAGKVLLDMKNHARWSSKFTTKLAADKAAADADFALLVSSGAMPAGEQQICIRDGVIVCATERVGALVALLRKIVLDNFVLRLSVERRDAKAERLFDFVVGPAGSDLFDRLAKLTADLGALAAIDEKNTRARWDRQARIVQGIMAVHDQFVQTVASLIAESGDAEHESGDESITQAMLIDEEASA